MRERTRTAQSFADQLFQGAGASTRVKATRQALTRALEAWWRHGALPEIGLLRDGLLVLEAGNALDEGERALLLRAALYHGKGMHTALKHQRESERTALVFLDMLLAPRERLDPEQVLALRNRCVDADWFLQLRELLDQETKQPLEPRRTRAGHVLAALAGDSLPPSDPWSPSAIAGSPVAKTPVDRTSGIELSRLFILISLLLILGAAWLFAEYWQGRDILPATMRRIPAGTYLVPPLSSDEAASTGSAGAVGGKARGRPVSVQAFAIDRTEVTNSDYRACLAAERCSWPRALNSATRPDYFLDPILGDYPVVNVTWRQASDYCAWMGKRLPVREEWEIAAGSAMTLLERFRFPWGDTYLPGAANDRSLGAGDTRPTASFSPGGDSAAGVSDMAGNVAEWTASSVGSAMLEEAGRRSIVKGGSFRSVPAEIEIGASTEVDRTHSEPWIGFRCALTIASS